MTMNSEFATIALDQVRYSLVWEDSRTLYAGLAIAPDDHVLVITSAGCNVLNALLAGPRQVTAIDLNPVQNALLRLKCHLISYHGPGVLRGLMGFDGPAAVARAWARVAAHAARGDGGVLAAVFCGSTRRACSRPGGWKATSRASCPRCPAAMQAALRHLLTFENVAAQQALFCR